MKTDGFIVHLKTIKSYNLRMKIKQLVIFIIIIKVIIIIVMIIIIMVTVIIIKL